MGWHNVTWCRYTCIDGDVVPCSIAFWIVCFVFLETTTVPDLLSIAIIDSLQLNIAFGLSLNCSWSIVSSKRSKYCFQTVVFPILDLPRSTLSGFLLVRLCLALKFLYHLSPGPVSGLNLLGMVLLLAMAQAKALTAGIDKGWLIEAI